MSMYILGRNFLQNNFFKGVAGPSLGYLNTGFLTDVPQKRKDNTIHRVATDSFTFNGGNGVPEDSALPKPNRVDPNQWVKDTKTGVWGRLYTDNRNESVLITDQNASVKIDNALTLEKMA